MRCRAVRRAERYIGLAVLVGMSGGAGAQEAQTSLLVSTGASVERNPYSDVNSSGAQVAATADLQPQLRLRSERTTIDLNGLAQFRQFFRRFGLEDNYSANGNIVSRLSDRITLRTAGTFSYNQGGFGAGRAVVSPNVPATFDAGVVLPDPLINLIDATILGSRARVQTLNGTVGADAQLSAYSVVSLDLSGRSVRFKRSGFGDYNNVSAEFRFTRELSEFTSVGAIADISRADYIGTRVGDAQTLSVLGTLDRRLGAEWSLSASAGLSRTRIDQLLGQPDENFSSFTARLRFCRDAQYSRFCVNANRATEPSANGSVRVSNAIEANYWRRLSDRDSVSVTGSFSRTGPGRGLAAALPGAKFVSASTRYDKQLNQTMTAFLGANFSKIYTPIYPSKANIGVSAGVQFRFGALQ